MLEEIASLNFSILIIGRKWVNKRYYDLDPFAGINKYRKGPINMVWL